VLEDATHQAGPEFVQKAALYNIETFFGWVWGSVADFKGVRVGQIAPTLKRCRAFQEA
jgi:ureidoacrylate peracid hydrolase